MLAFDTWHCRLEERKPMMFLIFLVQYSGLCHPSICPELKSGGRFHFSGFVSFPPRQFFVVPVRNRY
jgi:hypothetical protein